MFNQAKQPREERKARKQVLTKSIVLWFVQNSVLLV